MTIPPDSHSNGVPMPPTPGSVALGPTAELTALAAHLRRLADRVDDLDRRCQDLTHTLATHVLPEVTDLREHTADQLAEHAAQLRGLIDIVTPGTDQPAEEPTDWATMDAATATRRWGELPTESTTPSCPGTRSPATNYPTAGRCTAPPSSTSPGYTPPTARPTDPAPRRT